VIGAWTRLSPIAAISRRRSDAVWENFEYLMRRIALDDEWLEADKQYAASLAPA
jgi:hypothetical protein